MTTFQIVSLLVAGPVGLIQLLYAIRGAAGKGGFDFLHGVLLFGSLTIILVAFLGTK